MSVPYIPNYINQYPYKSNNINNTALNNTNNDNNTRSNKRQRSDSPVTTYERNTQRTSHNTTPAVSPSPTPYNTNTTTINVQPYYSNNGNDTYNKYNNNYNNGNNSFIPIPVLHSTNPLSPSTKYEKPELSYKNRFNKFCRMCIDSIQNTFTSISNSQFIKQIRHRYKSLPSDVREKLMFTLSSMIGTALFLILFESINQLMLYSVELNTTVDTAFLISYTASYLISIVWQHALNNMLLTSYNTQDIGYCASLIHTYTVYSASLAIVSLFGSLAIRYLYAPARLIALMSIPFAGIINYYSLQNDTMNSCIEQCMEQYSSGNTNDTIQNVNRRNTNNVYVFTPTKDNVSSTVLYHNINNVPKPTTYNVQQQAYNNVPRDSNSIAI